MTFTPGAELARLRAAAPLVHNITNFVAMSTMANVQLAIGASPAMLHAREEVAEFAPLASALTINIGTLSGEWLAGMLDAAAAANRADRPWVLDPVAVGATSFRWHREQGVVSSSGRAMWWQFTQEVSPPSRSLCSLWGNSVVTPPRFPSMSKAVL